VAGRSRFVHQQSLTRFLDGVAWMSQIGMFVVLGLLVFPSNLPDVAVDGLVIAAALILVARPASVLLSLAPFGVPLRDQGLIAWVGLRGAAPIILATFALTEGIEDAGLIFDVVFFVVLTSVLVQGTTIPVVGRWLGVAEPMAAPTSWPIEVTTGTPDGSTLHELAIAPSSAAAGRAVMDLRIPPGTMIVLVERAGSFAVPTGSTVLAADDKLLVLADGEGAERLRHLADGVA